MITAITAALTAIKEFFGWRTSVTQNKPTLEVVKDKKSLKKGTNYAEKIFEITDKYTQYFEDKDLRKYKSLKKKFNKNN